MICSSVNGEHLDVNFEDQSTSHSSSSRQMVSTQYRYVSAPLVESGLQQSFKMAPKKPQKELPQITPKNTDTLQDVPQTDATTLRLIWNLCHLCNVTTSSISVWLSLEALARESSANGSLHGSYIAYQPAMRAHAMMLSDVCRNLEVRALFNSS